MVDLQACNIRSSGDVIFAFVHNWQIFPKPVTYYILNDLASYVCLIDNYVATYIIKYNFYLNFY